MSSKHKKIHKLKKPSNSHSCTAHWNQMRAAATKTPRGYHLAPTSTQRGLQMVDLELRSPGGLWPAIMHRVYNILYDADTTAMQGVRLSPSHLSHVSRIFKEIIDVLPNVALGSHLSPKAITCNYYRQTFETTGSIFQNALTEHILQSQDRPIYENNKQGTEWRYTQSFSTKADGTLPFRSVGGVSSMIRWPNELWQSWTVHSESLLNPKNCSVLMFLHHMKKQ